MPVARSPAPRMTTSIRSLFSEFEMVWSGHGAGVMSWVLPAAGPLIDHFPGDAHGDLRWGHGLDGCSHRGVDSAELFLGDTGLPEPGVDGGDFAREPMTPT